MKFAHGTRLASDILLALAATAAIAGWEKFAETVMAVHYLDPASIRKDGNFRRVWELQDFKKPDSAGAMSQRFLWEFECRESQYRRVASSSHSEPHLGGTILQISSDSGLMVAFPTPLNSELIRPQVQVTPIFMSIVPPNSNIAAIHAKVCAD